MKIGVLGNSVSLIMRPPRRCKAEKTYAEILEKEMGHIICHAGKRGAIISDAYSYLEDEIIRFYPDVIIIHFGIVEAVPRMRNRLVQKHADRREYKNSVFLSKYPLSIKDKLFDGVLIVCSKGIELVRKICGKYINWLSINDYKVILKEYVNQIKKEIDAKIILIGIGYPGEVLEKKCPGTMLNVIQYNKVLLECSEENGDVYFLDVFNEVGMDVCIPDGSHFNSAGHRIIAEKIQLLLKEDLVDDK